MSQPPYQPYSQQPQPGRPPYSPEPQPYGQQPFGCQQPYAQQPYGLPAPYGSHAAPMPTASPKSPGVAALLSFLITGAWAPVLRQPAVRRHVVHVGHGLLASRSLLVLRLLLAAFRVDRRRVDAYISTQDSTAATTSSSSGTGRDLLPTERVRPRQSTGPPPSPSALHACPRRAWMTRKPPFWGGRPPRRSGETRPHLIRYWLARDT